MARLPALLTGVCGLPLFEDLLGDSRELLGKVLPYLFTSAVGLFLVASLRLPGLLVIGLLALLLLPLWLLASRCRGLVSRFSTPIPVLHLAPHISD